MYCVSEELNYLWLSRDIIKILIIQVGSDDSHTLMSEARLYSDSPYQVSGH